MTSTQELTTSEFYRMLRSLNHNFRIYCGENDGRLAGLAILRNQGCVSEDICGVDKNFVPAYTTFDRGGHIIKSGWRRVIWILLNHDYISVSDIKRVCPGFFDTRACGNDKTVGGEIGDPIDNKILKYSLENEVLTKEQILDVAKDVRAKDTPQQAEQREKEVWFLETWKKRGGNLADKPTI